MKKVILCLLTTILVPTLSACQDKTHSVISINVNSQYDNYVELNYNSLKNLIDSGQDFVLESYSPTCSHCVDLKEKLDRYIEKENQVIYRMNLLSITQDEMNELENDYPDIYPNSYVPSINLVKDGKLTYTVDPYKFDNYKTVASNIKNHSIKSNITIVNSWDSFKDYVDNQNHYIVYAYDLDNFDSIKLSKNHLISDKIIKEKINVLLINYQQIGSTYIDICQYFQASDQHFASIIQNNEQKKTINYLEDDGSALEYLVSIY